MKFFIDTADTEEIREAHALGILDGVTTNPSLVAKTGKKFRDVIAEICDIVPGPVSAEVVAEKADDFYSEGKELAKIEIRKGFAINSNEGRLMQLWREATQ